MENTYLVDIIRTLTPDEKAEMDLMLASPFFVRRKRGEELQRLWQYLAVDCFSGNRTAPDKDEAYRTVFPGTAFVAGKLEKTMVELNQLLRQLLLWRTYFDKENEFQQHYDFANVLKSRNLKHRYELALQKMQQIQVQKQFKDESYFYRQFRLEFAITEWKSANNLKKDDINIPNTLQNLDLFYQLIRLELLNYYLLQQRMAQLEISEEINLLLQLSRIPDTYMDLSGQLLLWAKIFRLLQLPNPTIADFNDLKNHLNKNEAQLSPDKVKEFYTYLRNFCVMLIHNGADDLLPVLFEIQLDHLERGFMYSVPGTQKISPSSCLNLINVALLNKKYDWVLNFLESHRDSIIGDNEDRDLYRLNKAIYQFATGQFEEALANIPANSEYLDYYLIARRLEIKIYFETESPLLPYKADAFKVQISRMSHKFLSNELKRRNADFLNILLQIMQSIPGDRSRMELLNKRIQDKKGIADRQWLLEKIRQLA